MLTAAGLLAQSHTVVAGLGDWAPNAAWACAGAMLSVLMGVALDVSGALDKMRELRRRQRETKRREKKEKEARDSEGGPSIDELGQSLKSSMRGRQTTRRASSYTPEKEDRAPDGSPFAAALRSLREGLRMLLQGMSEMLGLVVLIRWVALIYLLLVVGVICLEPMMVKLGFSADAATGAVIADVVLMGLTGAWLLTGIRAEASSILVRLLETVVLIAVFLGASLLVAATGTVSYGALCVFFGGVFYLKAFKRR